MSAILSIDDLNDFISPSIACIKPLETLPTANTIVNKKKESEVIVDGTQAAAAITSAEAVQISLTDCLACSGCVTSAEAVLVGLQSHAEVLATLDLAPALKVRAEENTGRWAVEGLDDENARLFVASVCPQTRANLAAVCGGRASEQQAGLMIERLFRGENGLAAGGKYKNGFTWVLDTNVAREATLVLGADEVLEMSGTSARPTPRPVLSSACPGWVCYAEKTHPHVLPVLSKIKSPQAFLGTMLKTTLSRKLGIPPHRIWHLAVMPCFDKKLEASREELTDEVWAGSGLPGRGVRDVDCVITSKEVLMLAESRGLDFFDSTCDATPAYSLPPVPPFPSKELQDFLFPPLVRKQVPRTAGSSGGLLYHILQRKAAQIPGAQIHTTRGRNSDVVEFVVAVGGSPVFKAARYYGFRNIQNLVRRLKPARASRMPGGKPFGSARRPTGKQTALEYGYVEVMACPGGCTNGGGQVKIDDPVVLDRKKLLGRPGPQEQKEWLAEVDEAYFSCEDPNDMTRNGNDDDHEFQSGDVIGGISRSYVHDTLAYWCRVTGISIDKLAFTTYREVNSDVGKATEAEKVVQLAGKVGGGW
ncbi:Cytosolic Fe-S cluster assembly factor nar1 [Claviceps pazoutovae]|uniref:Cytosolic Fe-S cluster assembly factor NAR1 n=1 Tax=Claviceps pazoutovae TaxID=1649127 RepID=A0A9P7SE45_9HYPO|nr:Cytosolic Fe-S cluster assembly factor nar1 [Claviceps pazoutovae]